MKDKKATASRPSKKPSSQRPKPKKRTSTAQRNHPCENCAPQVKRTQESCVLVHDPIKLYLGKDGQVNRTPQKKLPSSNVLFVVEFVGIILVTLALFFLMWKCFFMRSI